METIVHHGTETAYDKAARQLLINFFGTNIALRGKALKKYFKKTKQTSENFSAIIFVTEHFIIFRETVEEAYRDALDCDCEHPSFIRVWQDEGAINCICAAEMFLFGGFESDLYDETYRLKKEVLAKAIEIIKQNLEIAT